MQAATSSYSQCTGRGLSWYPSVRFAEPSSVMGFCSGFPAPWWWHFSQEGFSARVSPCPPKFFLLKTSSPLWSHWHSGSKSWGREICQECSSLWQRTTGTSGSWKKPPALHSPSLMVVKQRLAHVPLLSVGCPYWREKSTRSYWRVVEQHQGSECFTVYQNWASPERFSHWLLPPLQDCLCPHLQRTSAVTGPGCRGWAPYFKAHKCTPAQKAPSWPIPPTLKTAFTDAKICLDQKRSRSSLVCADHAENNPIKKKKLLLTTRGGCETQGGRRTTVSWDAGAFSGSMSACCRFTPV